VRDDRLFYRIAEMHFADEAAYERYLRWFDPIQSRPNAVRPGVPRSGSTPWPRPPSSSATVVVPSTTPSVSREWPRRRAIAAPAGQALLCEVPR
jgi:hypothetical protein